MSEVDDVQELEQEAPEVEEVEGEESPETEQEAEQPAKAEKKAVPEFTPEQQAVFNETIGKKVAKQREAERLADERQRELDEVRRKLQQYESPVRPDIPPPPDPYDDNFQEKVRQRDAQIAAAARWDGQQQYAEQLRISQEQEEQRKQYEQITQVAQSYTKKAETLGVSADELKMAGAALVQYGIPDRLSSRILRDDRGPEITTYLAKNLVEFDQLVRMEPEDAAVYLETIIKPKARKKPPEKVPDPAHSPGGAGMPEGRRGPAGATYE